MCIIRHITFPTLDSGDAGYESSRRPGHPTPQGPRRRHPLRRAFRTARPAQRHLIVDATSHQGSTRIRPFRADPDPLTLTLPLSGHSVVIRIQIISHVPPVMKLSYSLTLTLTLTHG